jgi:hypothetical protein
MIDRTLRGIAGRLLCWLIPGVVLLVGLLGAGQGGLADWRGARAVAVHSDDWGLAGYAPDAATAAALDLAALRPGHFPAAYLASTLESAGDVDRLADLLAAHRGRDGLPPVFQPNYILGSQTYEPADAAAPWRTRLLPELPPLYARPGLWQAVDRARRLGVWSPELHGLWHYDPALRRAAVAAEPSAARAAADGVLLFPDAARACELGAWRDAASLDAELATALDVFAGLFGERPSSVIAPDYRWSGRDEARWLRAGIRGVQAKREQRRTRVGGWPCRLGKVLDRGRSKAWDRDRVYIERNVRLETAQLPDAATAAARCLAGVRSAWASGRPAVIETHRLNYAHLDPVVAETGRTALDRVLADLEAAPPALRPLYLADREIVALERRGVSARRAGDVWILRNLTHTRRPVFLPEETGRRVVWLEPGVTRTVAAATLSD